MYTLHNNSLYGQVIADTALLPVSKEKLIADTPYCLTLTGIDPDTFIAPDCLTVTLIAHTSNA